MDMLSRIFLSARLPRFGQCRSAGHRSQRGAWSASRSRRVWNVTAL